MEEIVNESEENVTTKLKDPIEELVRAGAQKMLQIALEEEITAFIESHKDMKSADGHRMVVRNGYHRERTIQTTSGSIQIKQPRIDDRKLKKDERFKSCILPKFMRKSPTLEGAIPILYLKGLSGNKFTSALKEIFGEDAKGFSPSTITRLKKSWIKEFEKWKKRSLEGKEYVYVWADGVYCNSRLDDNKLCLLVIIGVRPDGVKELLAVQDGVRESEESWSEVLRDLQNRGLTKAPKLAVCDGALGFQKAVDKIWGPMKIQRCWFHKMGNVLDKLPKSMQTKATEKMRNIFLAETKEKAEEAYREFIRTFELKYPKAVECLTKDHEDLFRFYDYPAEHWVHIRTSNPIESTFATVRLRHKTTKGNGTSEATKGMAFKLCKEAEKNWKKIKGFEKLQLVLDDKIFKDGILAA